MIRDLTDGEFLGRERMIAARSTRDPRDPRDPRDQ
jgi:hypothetical protein